ncbi:hypothetical protein RJT34_31393 [Clitoria ternatea]|uniref:Uncharacterized protein n=1 Tax=Clitoria ternatea TaxID=43366 RepID=A0AAN9EUZ1_CLITE
MQDLLSITSVRNLFSFFIYYQKKMKRNQSVEDESLGVSGPTGSDNVYKESIRVGQHSEYAKRVDRIDILDTDWLPGRLRLPLTLRTAMQFTRGLYTGVSSEWKLSRTIAPSGISQINPSWVEGSE